MQTEFLKNVRQNLTQVQQKATARIESLNGDARKIFTDVVEKGKASQKELGDKLQKTVKPAAETAAKRISEAREKARVYVEDTSREQAGAVAGGLRKVAQRLDRLAQKSATVSAGVQTH